MKFDTPPTPEPKWGKPNILMEWRGDFGSLDFGCGLRSRRVSVNRDLGDEQPSSVFSGMGYLFGDDPEECCGGLPESWCDPNASPLRAGGDVVVVNSDGCLVKASLPAEE